MRIPVVDQRFVTCATCDILLHNLIQSIISDNDLVLLHSSSGEVSYRYAGYLPIHEDTGFILKGQRNAFEGCVCISRNAQGAKVRFRVLVGIRTLVVIPCLLVAFFGGPIIVLRAVVWSTLALRDRIGGATLSAIWIGLGVFAFRLFKQRISREITSLRRPVRTILMAHQGK